jgi:hypothetical protein
MGPPSSLSPLSRISWAFWMVVHECYVQWWLAGPLSEVCPRSNLASLPSHKDFLPSCRVLQVFVLVVLGMPQSLRSTQRLPISTPEFVSQHLSKDARPYDLQLCGTSSYGINKDSPQFQRACDAYKNVAEIPRDRRINLGQLRVVRTLGKVSVNSSYTSLTLP